MGVQGQTLVGRFFISVILKGLTRRRKYNFRSNSCQLNIYL